MHLFILLVFPALSLLETSDDTIYFPPGLFYEDPEWDSGAVEVVVRYLEALGESSLIERRTEAEIYRLLWLPGFDPGVMVRVAHSDTIQVHVGFFAGNSPSDEATVRSFELAPESWNRLTTTIDEAGFWEEIENKPVPAGHMVIDGSHWVLEGLKDGKYKAVQRIFPHKERPQDAPFLEIGLVLLEIGGIDLEERVIY